jgi:hypothetical protein
MAPFGDIVPYPVKPRMLKGAKDRYEADCAKRLTEQNAAAFFFGQ